MTQRGAGTKRGGLFPLLGPAINVAFCPEADRAGWPVTTARSALFREVGLQSKITFWETFSIIAYAYLFVRKWVTVLFWKTFAFVQIFFCFILDNSDKCPIFVFVFSQKTF